MSATGAAKDGRAGGAQPTPEGPVRAHGRRPIRCFVHLHDGAMRAIRRGRRRAIPARPTAQCSHMSLLEEAEG